MASHDDEDVAVDDGEEGHGGAKKGKKKLIVIILAVLILAGGGAGAYFFLIKKKDAGAPATKTEASEGKPAEGEGAAKAGAPHFLSLPEFLVNLNTGSSQTSFIKVSITLQLASDEDEKKAEEMQPVIVDDVNTYLRELRTSDLAGSAGLERLREELLTRINKALAPVKVGNVLFKQIVVQ